MSSLQHNSTENFSNQLTAVTITLLILQIIVFIVGIIGNSLVIFAITFYKRVRRKSVANYYIWNLALSDELFVLTLPSEIYASFSYDYIFGNFLCQLFNVFKETNRICSVWNLVALSVDRYLATFQDRSHLRTINRGKAVCLCIWVGSMLVSTPYWLYAGTIYYKEDNRQDQSYSFIKLINNNFY